MRVTVRARVGVRARVRASGDFSHDAVLGMRPEP